MPTRPFYRKVNPGRRADHDPLAHERRRSQSAQVSDAATTILSQRIAQVDGVGQVFVGGGRAARGARSSRSCGARAVSASRWRTSERRSQTLHRRRAPKGWPPGRPRSQHADAPTISSSAPRRVRVLVIAAPTADSRRAPRATSLTSIDSVENERVAGLDQRRARRVLVIIRRQPGANIVETNDRIKALLAGARARRSRRRSTSRSRSTVRSSDPRLGRRTWSDTLVISADRWWSLVVFVFLRDRRVRPLFRASPFRCRSSARSASCTCWATASTTCR